MVKDNGKIIIVALVLLFLMSFMNTCNSCSSSRKIDELSTKVGAIGKQNDSLVSVQTKYIELRLDLLQPQIVNQFLSMFNSEKYSNEMKMNDAKILSLQQQISILKEKNDTTKANR